MATVAIFLPCYNAAEFIDICILSLIAQSYCDFVVLAYDDNSEDMTYERLKFWSSIDKRILVRQPWNTRVGYVHLLNRMLLDIDSKYIFRQDADDWSLPSRLSVQLNFMEADLNCVLCGTQGMNILHEENLLFTYPWEKRHVNNVASYTQPVNTLLQSHHRVIHGSMCIRTERLRELDGYDADMVPVEDWDLCLRASSLGTIYVIPEILYIRRLHNHNTAKGHPNKELAIRRIIERHSLSDYQFISFRSTLAQKGKM